MWIAAVTVVLAALVAGALVFSLLSVVAALRYLSVTTPEPPANAEPVSILKPLAGLDLDLRDATDPAVAVVEKLRAEYARVPSRLLIVGEPPYANAKVFSLDRMLDEAANDLVVMSDSDIRVTEEMLRTVAAEFADGKTGVATCPYRAVAGGSVWSRLEALGMNTDFIAGILMARMLEGMKFAVGPTIVARRRVLRAIGGFDRLKDYLAEDFVLGKFAAAAGYGVILSSYVIEHHIGSSDLRHSAGHRLRWMRSTRRSRPWGYLGQIFTMPFPLALLLWAVHPTWGPLAASVFAVRVGAAWIMARVLEADLEWWLLPFEDVINFVFWIAGFFGNTIEWRGRRYRLRADGKFELLAGD